MLSPCSRRSCRPLSPSRFKTSRTLLWGAKSAASDTRCRLGAPDDHPVPVPEFGDANRRIAGVSKLQAPNAVHLNGRHRELALRVLALEGLEEGDAVEHEGAGHVDGVDPAAFAGAVDAGRAGAEGVGHRDYVNCSTPLSRRGDSPLEAPGLAEPA